MDKFIYLVLVIVGTVLTVFGHRQIGPSGLMMMLLGLGMFIVLLWTYNRKYR